MERNNRTLLVVLIAAVVVAAVFASFGLPLFANPTATITLPTPAPGETPGGGEDAQSGVTRVEVAPNTVQSVIAALSRLESYSRTVTVTMEGAELTARVWVDGDWTRTDLTIPQRPTAHTIVGEDTVWRWYDGDSQAVSWSAREGSADVEGQHIPTYEDVLALDKRSITAAGYETKNDFDCVFAEVSVPELGQTERYWVSADNGLLVAAETVVGEDVVYSMTAAAPEFPVPASASFALPDGTVLHAVGGE